MRPEIVKQWDDRKHILEVFFKENKQSEYSTYLQIVKKLMEFVIIDAKGYGDKWEQKWNLKDIRELDFGDYQGDLIFFIPRETYQPSADEILVTTVSYGSCSGCDTLQGICGYRESDLPSDQQVQDYMSLALHLVQNMKLLYESDEVNW
jgi:PII-like signaling protein